MSTANTQPRKSAGPRSTGMTQRERRELSERRVISAALKVIAQHGVAGATLAEIGETAGYSRGLPAHLFGNKDMLLAECMRRLMFDYWTDRFPEIGSDGPFATLVTAVDRWLHELTELPERPRAHLLLLQEAAARDAETIYPEFVPVARTLVKGSQSRLYAYILAGQDSNEIRPEIDAKFESLIIHTTLRGVSQRWLINDQSVCITDFRDKYIEYLKDRLLIQKTTGG